MMERGQTDVQGIQSRVIIFGWAKSGTTALFYKVRDSFRPENVQEVFEPKGKFNIREDPKKNVLLVKALWYGVTADDFVTYEFFDKKNMDFT